MVPAAQPLQIPTAATPHSGGLHPGAAGQLERVFLPHVPLSRVSYPRSRKGSQDRGSELGRSQDKRVGPTHEGPEQLPVEDHTGQEHAFHTI